VGPRRHQSDTSARAGVGRPATGHQESGRDDFVKSLVHRIAKFPAAGLITVKDRVNAIALAPVEDFRRDSDLFGDGARNSEVQSRLQAALKRGLQTRDAEMDLARLLGDLPDH
jgi:hypothetical protein